MQHGVVARPQLLGLGITVDAIQYWLAVGRLHPVHLGVYAVGRPDLTVHGQWAAALLACSGAATPLSECSHQLGLSHRTAGVLWGLCSCGPRIDVSIRRSAPARRRGIRAYRRAALPLDDVVIEQGLPVTTPARTVIDLAVRFAREPLEAVINEADRRGLISPEGLRDELDRRGPAPGFRRLRAVLDRRTFRLTDSQLERRFMPIARRAGLTLPLTRQIVNGYRVDFYWPELGLVVETDGLRYHRTAERQSRDARRDQVHTAAGLTPLRFTHEQVRYHAGEVESTLRRVAQRLGT